MSTIAHGEDEAEGYQYFWMVNRASNRAYQACVFFRGPTGKREIQIAKELPARPSNKEAAKLACDELVPQLLKVLRNLR